NGCNPDIPDAGSLRATVLDRRDSRAHGARPRWALRASRISRRGTCVKEVYFVVLPQLVLLDLAGPAEAFRIASRRAAGSYRLHFIAPTRSLQAAIGLQLSDLELLPEKLSQDSIVVLTGVTGATVDLNEPVTQQVICWLKSGVTAPGMLLCVCAGSV